MANIFLSYAHKDSEMAEAFGNTLRDAGVTVFTDDAIVAGDAFAPSIETAMRTSDAVVVLLSSASADSKFVQTEAQTALAAKKIVIPVHLDENSTKNFIWPLLADRQGLRIDPLHDISHAARDIARIISNQSESDLSEVTFGQSSLSLSRKAF